MEVSIQNEKKELLVHTVSLSRNDQNPENVYLFRCPYCSNTLGTQIQGIVTKISAGLEPSNEVPVLHLCRECKRLYVFQTLPYLEKKSAKVTLVAPHEAIGIFYCWLCRNPLMQFRGDKVMKLPNFELVKLPFTMDCVNATCPAKYRVADIVQM